MFKQQAKKLAKKIIIALFWLGLWQLLSAITGLSVLLPSPFEVALELYSLVFKSSFWLSVLNSIIRITIGLLLGVIIGTLTAIASCASNSVNSLLTPIVQITKATPVASFIVLAVVWLNTGNVPSFTSMLIVFPIMWSSIKTGIKQTDKSLLEMARAFNVTFKKQLKNIYIPSVMPYFISSATTSMGLAWKSGIAAEVICNPKNSIGSGIYQSKIYLETPTLFAWTITVIIISVILEKLMVYLLKKVKQNA